MNATSCFVVTNADSKEQQKDTGDITDLNSAVPCVLKNIIEKIWRDKDANRSSNKCD